MKVFVLVLILFSSLSFAEEECVFNPSAFTNFRDEYIGKNDNAKLGADNESLLVLRENESIIIKGGGCMHLSTMIQATTNQEYNEELFIQKVLTLSIEFGDWLINTEELKQSIEQKKWVIQGGVYFFQIDEITDFEAWHDKKGDISVSFYIN